MNDLQKRILSSVILIPVVVLCLYAGPFYARGLAVALTCVLLLEWILMSFSARKPDFPGIIIFFAGLFYVLGSSLFLIHILEMPEGLGVDFILMLFIIVWSTDSGAYFVGRALKGPKLALRLSPNKTWSGFFGGLILGTVIGSGGVYFIGGTEAWIKFIPIVLGLSFVGQLGDLLESAAKRFWRVKDSGHLIPGHGGLLDRLDSLLGIAFFLAIWQSLM